MLSPKRTKFRKYQKPLVPGIKINLTSNKFGKYGLKSLESTLITAKTIEAVRRAITRKIKKTVPGSSAGGKIWIRVFPDVSVSEKPLEVRMGKGKGEPSFWVSRVQAGEILFEMDGISKQLAQQAFKLAYYKLPMKTQLITEL